MFTIAGFAQDVDLVGVMAPIDALADAHLFTQGDDLRVPELDRMLVIWGGLGSGGTEVMRLESPSLRDENRLVVRPCNGGADADVEPADPVALMDLTPGPRRLQRDEILQCHCDSNTTLAAFQWCIIAFGDGPPTPVTGDIIPVRAVSATAAVARAWTQVPIVFADALQAGRYQLVGLRALGASMIAARCVFKPGIWRPGCPGCDLHTSMDHPLFRMGRLGVWGEFDHTMPPDIEVLCNLADAAQQFDLDLIKTG